MNLKEISNNDNQNATIKNHFIIWVIYWLLQLWWRFDTHTIYDFIVSAIQVTTWAIVFYSLRLYLYPKFLWKNHWKLFFFMIISYFIFTQVSMIYTNYIIIISEGKDAKIYSYIMYSKRSLFWYFNMAFVAFGFTYYDELGKEKARRLEAEIELQETKIELKNSQLDSLKAQFNPHFLFNTLWYIYALVQDTGSKNATKAVELLSDMMRYSMKDYAVGSLAPLEDELNYVNNYIELQQLRTPMIKLDYQVEGDIEGVKILPLVLMSFVENAFKHGKLNESENPLVIHLTAVQGDYIRFFVKNKISLMGKERSNGIGLENVKKRLQSNYPNKHSLNITNQNQLYSSELILKIASHDNLRDS